MPATDDEWVAQLPAAVAVCAERWGLTVAAPLPGGLVGHVYACTTRSGDAAILKLTPPSSDGFAGTPEQEAAALRAWDGRGAVELLAFAAEQRALLTRRALPGTPLPPGAEHDALHAVAGVLSHLFDATIPRWTSHRWRRRPIDTWSGSSRPQAMRPRRSGH